MQLRRQSPRWAATECHLSSQWRIAPWSHHWPPLRLPQHLSRPHLCHPTAQNLPRRWHFLLPYTRRKPLSRRGKPNKFCGLRFGRPPRFGTAYGRCLHSACRRLALGSAAAKPKVAIEGCVGAYGVSEAAVALQTVAVVVEAATTKGTKVPFVGEVCTAIFPLENIPA